MLATASFLLFWQQHFERPHVRFQLMAAKSETEYNIIAAAAGYKIKPRKKRHRK